MQKKNFLNYYDTYEYCTLATVQSCGHIYIAAERSRTLPDTWLTD